MTPEQYPKQDGQRYADSANVKLIKAECKIAELQKPRICEICNAQSDSLTDNGLYALCANCYDYCNGNKTEIKPQLLLMLFAVLLTSRAV